MPEINITSKEITSLAGKLDEFGDVLTPEEQSLMLAVFGMASTALGSATEGAQTESGESVATKIGIDQASVMKLKGASANLPKLSSGFLDAFRPGQAGRFSVLGGEVQNSVDVSVGGACVSVGWSKDTGLEALGAINTLPNVNPANPVAGGLLPGKGFTKGGR